VANVAPLVSVPCMGLAPLVFDRHLQTLGTLFQHPLAPLVKSARNLGIPLSTAGNGTIHILPIKLTPISLICLYKTMSPTLLLCWASSLLGVPSSVEDPLCYPDCGATHHITNNSSAYTIKNPYDGTDTVKMGNGTGLKISAIGSTNLRSSTSNHDLVLTDLLHVSDITKNLISVSKFCRDNNVIF